VLGLGEHVQRCDPIDPVEAVGAEGLEIAGEGRGVTGHVQDLGGPGLAKRVDKGRCAADSGRVGDDQGVVGGKPLEQGRHPLFGGAGDEIAVGDAALLLVETGGFDRSLIDFDAGEAFHQGRAFKGEESDATVGVDEETRAAVADGVPDRFHEGRQEVKIVLEEGILGKLPAFGGDAEGDLDAAFGRGIGPHRDELFVEGGFGDGAMIDIDDETVVVADEAEDQFLGKLVPLTADHDAVAVPVGRRAGHHGIDAEFGETAEAEEEIEDLIVLDAELCGVIDVLVLAAAAVAEKAADGLGAVGGGLEDFDDPGAGIVFLNLGQFDEQAFAGDSEGGKDNEIVDASDGIAAIRDGIDGQFESLSDGVRGIALHEFRRGGVNLKERGEPRKIPSRLPWRGPLLR